MLHKALLTAVALTAFANTAAEEALPIDPQSGLVVDRNWELVRANCSACHSAELVTQNRMSADGWTTTIRWMQEEHELWDLGENEDRIVAYLAKHYGVPDLPLRRRPLNQAPLDQEEQSP